MSGLHSKVENTVEMKIISLYWQIWMTKELNITDTSLKLTL